MSKPIARRDSRSSIESSSESDSKELEKPGGKGNSPDKGKTSNVPTTSNRTLKRTGTWSKGYMPKDKAPMSGTDPLASPRPAKPRALPPPSSTKVASSSSSSSTPSTSNPQPAVSTASTSTKPMADNRTFARDLSPKVLSSVSIALEAGASLAPEKFGELLIAVESRGGKNKLAGDAIKRILRGALVIREFESTSGGGRTDVNVIARICEPFMYRHLDTPEFEKARKKFISEFAKVAKDFESLAKVIPQKEWTTSPDMKKLMDPIMKPVIELICGKDNKLESSALPDPVKKALLSIDKSGINWFAKNGTGKPADLLNARKNALIGFLSTRSLGHVWLTKAREEKSIDNAHLTRLISYMNSYVSTKIDDFVTDVLLKQPDQTTEARKYIEVLTNRSTLKSKPSVPKLLLGAGTTMAGAKILSARAATTFATQHSADARIVAENSAKKKAKETLIKMAAERAIFVDKIVLESGLDKIDHKFYQYAKEVILKMSKRGYDRFKKDPVKSLIKYADKYYAKLENHQQVKAGLPVKVRNALDAYGLKLIGNPFEDADNDVMPSPDTPTAKASKLEDSVETEPSEETEVETESSGDEEQS